MHSKIEQMINTKKRVEKNFNNNPPKRDLASNYASGRKSKRNESPSDYFDSPTKSITTRVSAMEMTQRKKMQ